MTTLETCQIVCITDDPKTGRAWYCEWCPNGKKAEMILSEGQPVTEDRPQKAPKKMGIVEVVETLEVSHERGIVINGRSFPYPVAVVPSIRVSPMPGFEEESHILWLPLIAKGPCPDIGEPDGTPVA